MERQFASICFVDVVESVRLVAAAEEAAVRQIQALLATLADSVAPAHQGQVLERRGDGLLVLFPSGPQAIQFAKRAHLAAREQAPAFAAPHPAPPPLQLRAGIHQAQLLHDGPNYYGAGLNLAARVAALAKPSETLLTAVARDALPGHWVAQLEDLGDCWLKHVDEPVRLFRSQAGAGQWPQELEQAISARMRMRPTLAVLTRLAPPHAASDVGSAFSLTDVAVDVLTRHLSQSQFLHVISGLSNQALRACLLPLEEVFQLLRADYALVAQPQAREEPLEGQGPSHSVVRMQFELVKRGVPEPLWKAPLSATASDWLSAEGHALGRVVEQVNERILGAERRLAQGAKALPNLATHTLYLNAVDLLHRFSAQSFDQARELLEELDHRAPRHAEPLAWMARWHVFRVVQGWSQDRKRDGQQALFCSARALERDAHSSLALTMAGAAQAGVNADPGAAQAYYEQALQHNPNDSMAWLMSGVAQGFMNAPPQALQASELALGLAPLDPTRPYFESLAATAALRANQVQRSISLAQRAIAGNGQHGSTYRTLAIAYGLTGQLAQAKATIQALLAIEPHFTIEHYLARVPAVDSHRDRYSQILLEAGLPKA